MKNFVTFARGKMAKMSLSAYNTNRIRMYNKISLKLWYSILSPFAGKKKHGIIIYLSVLICNHFIIFFIFLFSNFFDWSRSSFVYIAYLNKMKTINLSPVKRNHTFFFIRKKKLIFPLFLISIVRKYVLTFVKYLNFRPKRFSLKRWNKYHYRVSNWKMGLNFVIHPSNISTIRIWFFFSFIRFYWLAGLFNFILFQRV